MSRLSAADLKAIEQMVATVRSPKDEPPCADERMERFWWGEWDEEVAYALGMAGMVSEEPVAKILYEWHCAGDMAGAASITKLQAWCATTAADFAMQRNSRKRPTVQSFRLDWGRQAAHDGAALAMWDNARADIREVLPGVNKRSAKYGCTNDAYQRIRDHVEQEAKELIFRFRRDFEMALAGKFDPDFRCRWERVTGKLWPR